MIRPLRDRIEAGRLLAAQLAPYANRADLLVLALPRGGVPVAFEVARRLRAPLDVFVVRKLGAPGHEELAMGAISGVADEYVCALRPPLLDDVGRWYEDFSQTTDAEVRDLLERAAQELPDPAPAR